MYRACVHGGIHMSEGSLLYRCSCGFPCYSEGQEAYHRSRACISVKRVLAVVAARERSGHQVHVGVEVNGLVLRRMLTQEGGELACSCQFGPCPIHQQAA